MQAPFHVTILEDIMNYSYKCQLFPQKDSPLMRKKHLNEGIFYIIKKRQMKYTTTQQLPGMVAYEKGESGELLQERVKTV